MVGDRIRWGIAGTGGIAQQFVTGLACVDDAEAAAVASNTGRAQNFATEHQIPTAHDSYADMATDPDVDVVYVASTQERHVDDVLLFVGAGKAVLCEKPFALNLADAHQMIEAARAADVFLMEALWSRFLPSYVRLAALLADGAIGTPQLVEADFSFVVPDAAVATHRLFDLGRGGGALFDLGVYPINLAHVVLGVPDSVAAHGRLHASGVDEHVSLLLGYDSGASALLHAGIKTQGTCSARIAGTEGVIEMPPFFHAGNTLVLHRDGGEETIEVANPSLHFQVPEVHAALRSGAKESIVMSHQHTIDLMTTLDIARQQIGLAYPER